MGKIWKKTKHSEDVTITVHQQGEVPADARTEMLKMFEKAVEAVNADQSCAFFISVASRSPEIEHGFSVECMAASDGISLLESSAFFKETADVVLTTLDRVNES